MNGSIYANRLNQINEFLLNEVKDKPYRNYAYFFTPSDEKKISLSFRFNDTIDYYGLNPCVTVESIREQILQIDSSFSTAENLKKFAQSIQMKNLWHLNLEKFDKAMQEKISTGLLMKTMLTISLSFYFKIRFFHNDEKQRFMEIIESENWQNAAFSFSFISPNLKHRPTDVEEFMLFGRLPDTIIEKLYHSGYRFRFDDGVFTIGKFSENCVKSPYSPVYKEFLHCTSDFLYSGVNLRLVNAELPTDNISNKNLQTVLLTTERTTFATIYGFDGIVRGNTGENRIHSICHPFLKEYSEYLMIVEDDEAKSIFSMMETLKNQRSGCVESIAILNQYLDASIYPHYINISGNIITKDEYLIYTKRSDRATDRQTLYCSANGVCEVNDASVDFYTQSGTEADKPSILYVPGGYYSIFGEIERECEAELGISDFTAKWSCYGFSIMGLNPTEDSLCIESCHFNVLTYNTVNDSFNEVVHSWKTATEKEENHKLFGVKLFVFRSQGARLRSIAYSVIQTILAQKDTLLLLALLISRYLFSFVDIYSLIDILKKSVSEIGTGFDGNRFLKIIEAIIYVLLICSTIHSIVVYLKDRSQKHSVRVVMSKKFLPERILNSFYKGERKNCYAIAVIMSIMYYCQMEWTQINKKSKRK